MQQNQGSGRPQLRVIAGCPDVIGPCPCGGQLVTAAAEVTVEAGGQVVSRVEHDEPWCTSCGEGWKRTCGCE